MRTNLKNTFAGTAAAALVAASLIFNPVAANDAYAGDGHVKYIPVAADTTEARALRMAGSASNGRFALIVFSSNEKILKLAYQEAINIENTTSHDVTFLHVPHDSPVSRVMIIANGGDMLDTKNGGNLTALRQDIQSGFRNGLARLASAEPIRPPATS